MRPGKTYMPIIRVQLTRSFCIKPLQNKLPDSGQGTHLCPCLLVNFKSGLAARGASCSQVKQLSMIFVTLNLIAALTEAERQALPTL